MTAERSGERVTISLPIPPLEAPSTDEKAVQTFCDATGLEKGDVVQITPFRWSKGSTLVELDSKVDLKAMKVDIRALVRPFSAR